MNQTVMMRPNQTKYHVHQGIWCDIFPLAPIRSDRECRTKKKLLKVGNLLVIDDYLRACREDFEAEFNRKIIFMLDAMLKLPYSLRRALHRKLRKKLASHPEASRVCDVENRLGKPFPRAYLEGEYTELEFEGEMFRVMPRYRDYLEGEYGDYMQLPPESERGGHGKMIVDTERSYKDFLD